MLQKNQQPYSEVRAMNLMKGIAKKQAHNGTGDALAVLAGDNTVELIE